MRLIEDGGDPDPKDLTDEELLKRIAALDENQYPIARHAKRALTDDQDDEEGSS